MHKQGLGPGRRTAANQHDPFGKSSAVQSPLSQNERNILGTTSTTEGPKGREPLDRQSAGPSRSHGSERLPRDARKVVEDHPLGMDDAEFDETPGIKRLAEHTIRGVELDASSRYPPPRCHPETRRTLLGKLTHSIKDPNRGWSLLWLYGPAGVGKSAVAQTIAEYCRDQLGRLGAALFLSKNNGDVDPQRLLPTLAYQLATRFPPYRRLVSQLLEDHPTILEQRLVVQFKKFIIEPFASLKAGGELNAATPVLFVLDGLDECSVQEAQSDIIELIGGYVQTAEDHSLLWIISSRPESHLKAAFLKFATGNRCRTEEITVEGEGERDVFLYLQDRLRHVREKYLDIFEVDSDESWPSDAQLKTLSSAASGLFSFASFLTNFIGDMGVGDPKSQLTTFLKCLETNRFSDVEVNPLLPLDRDYTNILSSIPFDTRPTALRILNFCAYNPHHPLTLRELCNFFCLEPTTFLGSLRKVHSIVNVGFPDPDQSDRFNFYHASFGAFLRDPSRSGSFHIPEAKVFSDVALRSLRWFKFSNLRTCNLPDGSCCPLENKLELRWLSRNQGSRQRDMDVIEAYTSAICWKACLQAADKDAPMIHQELSHLRFCPSRPLAYPRDYLMDIIKRVYDWRLLSHVDEGEPDEIGDTSKARGVDQSEQERGRRLLCHEDAVTGLGVLTLVAVQYLAY